MDIVRAVLANSVLSKVIEDARDAIREGESIAAPLKRSGQFPPIVYHMIAIGERSGQLEEMLDNVADSYETQSEAAHHRADLAPGAADDRGHGRLRGLRRLLHPDAHPPAQLGHPLNHPEPISKPMTDSRFDRWIQRVALATLLALAAALVTTGVTLLYGPRAEAAAPKAPPATIP